MRKGKALLLGLVLAFMSICFYAEQQITMMLALAGCSLLAFGFSFSKYYRDTKLSPSSKRVCSRRSDFPNNPTNDK